MNHYKILRKGGFNKFENRKYMTPVVCHYYGPFLNIHKANPKINQQNSAKLLIPISGIFNFNT